MEELDPRLTMARSFRKQIDNVHNRFWFYLILIVFFNMVAMLILSNYAMLRSALIVGAVGMIALIALKLYFGRAVKQIEQLFYTQLDQSNK